MKKSLLYFLMIFVFGMLMSIGYATISDEHLYITGTATAPKMTGLFISQARISSSSNGSITGSRINAYGQTVLNSHVVLDANDSGAYLIMSVTITNNTNEPQVFDKIVYDSSFYDNANVVVETNGGLTHGAVISANGVANFNVIFSYDSDYINNNSSPYDNVLNGVISFKFGIDSPPPSTVHNVTYNHITSGTLPATVDDGQDLVAVFTGTVPNSIFVNGSSNYSYNSGTLVVYNVTNDLIISSIDNIQLPISNSGSGVASINFPGFDTQVSLNNYVGMSFLGENFSDMTITSMEVVVNYTSTIGAAKTATISLVSDGNTQSQTITFSRANNADCTINYTGLDIGLGDQFTISVSSGDSNSNIKINSMTLTAYYS